MEILTLEDIVLIGTSFKSLLFEFLDWPSISYNSKIRVPGVVITPARTVMFLFTSVCTHL